MQDTSVRKKSLSKKNLLNSVLAEPGFFFLEDCESEHCTNTPIYIILDCSRIGAGRSYKKIAD